MASVDVVIPVYNEEHVLADSVATLRDFLRDNLPHTWRIVVADNASTDGTLAVAQRLAEENNDVIPFHIPQKGRGRALRATWLASEADILTYMDVDLSTDIAFFPALVAAISDEGYDVAIGSRLKKGAKTTRSFRRELTSRVYNVMIKAAFFTRFQDAQCGFKAISRQAAHEIIPLIKNEEWFFDTELLILAEKGGYRVKEIPVRWREDPDTRVNIRKTAMEDIRGLTRMRFTRIPKKPPRG
ncbi:MAG: glycosyltransferase family 2 protein [Dehalococcoidia bacterium]|nr:glycosyltransferase family 2 protein [Dehalococcoidia bacterium]